jgi:hypothetical protein
VRNPISQAYFSVRAAKKSASQQQTLVSWKQADLDGNKWRKTATRAGDQVFGLVVHPQLPEDVVVVYANANAQFECDDGALTRVLDSSAMEDANEVDGTVVWVSLASSHRNPAKGGRRHRRRPSLSLVESGRSATWSWPRRWCRRSSFGGIPSLVSRSCRPKSRPTRMATRACRSPLTLGTSGAS